MSELYKALVFRSSTGRRDSQSHPRNQQRKRRWSKSGPTDIGCPACIVRKRCLRNTVSEPSSDCPENRRRTGYCNSAAGRSDSSHHSGNPKRKSRLSNAYPGDNLSRSGIGCICCLHNKESVTNIGYPNNSRRIAFDSIADRSNSHCSVGIRYNH